MYFLFEEFLGLISYLIPLMRRNLSSNLGLQCEAALNSSFIAYTIFDKNIWTIIALAFYIVNDARFYCIYSVWNILYYLTKLYLSYFKKWISFVELIYLFCFVFLANKSQRVFRQIFFKISHFVSENTKIINEILF